MFCRNKIKFLFQFTSLVLLFSALPCSAQFYLTENFNAESGLPSPEVYGMLQDSKGYMWFATDMGVSRYNGYEFKNYSSENGLPDNTVFGFFEDHKKRVWFRSFSGRLSYFLNDSIHTLPCNKKLESIIASDLLIVSCIYVDEKDTIWLGTTNKKYIKISPEWNEKDVRVTEIPANGAYLILLNKNHLIFGGSDMNNSIISLYNKNLKKIVSINTQVELSGKSRTRYFGDVLPDGSFIASNNNKVWIFNEKGILSQAEINSTFHTFHEAGNGLIYSASMNGIRTHQKSNLGNYELLPGFSGKVFTEVLVDRENSLWLATEGQGVYHIPFPENKYYTSDNGLTKSKICAIISLDDHIITGSLDGSMFVIDSSTLSPVIFDRKKFVPVAMPRINCFFKNSKNELLVANGLITYKLSKSPPYHCSELTEPGCKKIMVAKNGKLWVLRDRHIQLCEPDDKLSIIKEFVFKQYIDDIFEDSKGTLWIAALNGLSVVHNDSIVSMGGKNKLLNSRIIQILEDADSRLWLATRGEGLIVKEGNSFYNIKQKDGLASNMCRQMLIEDGNLLWVGGNKGISRIQINKDARNSFSYKIDVFTKRNGLLSNEVNYILRKGNKLLLSHNNGLTMFDPLNLQNNKVPPPVYINSLNVPSGKLSGINSVQLDYSGNFIEINFTGISYKNTEAIEYKYKMEGLDTSWVSTVYTSVRFQSLAPGNYTFIVLAKNNDGYWSANPAEFKITVLPAWWQTWWFRIIASTLVLASIYWLIKKRLDLVRKREIEKSELKTKIAVTELKALRAQMNPHFIFNAINSVQHFITSNDPESSQRYLSKFAKLIRYVVDNSKPGYIPLNIELDALKLYIELEALRFDKRFEYSIDVNDNIDKYSVKIPSMIIQPFVENAIWHGVMHKEDGPGKIKIELKLAGEMLHCTIEDNGIGREKSAELKSQQNIRTHKSVGILITKERLDIINQVSGSDMSLNVTDLRHMDGRPAGTKIELFIPLQ